MKHLVQSVFIIVNNTMLFRKANVDVGIEVLTLRLLIGWWFQISVALCVILF